MEDFDLGLFTLHYEAAIARKIYRVRYILYILSRPNIEDMSFTAAIVTQTKMISAGLLFSQLNNYLVPP